MVFAHVDTCHHRLVVEQVLGQGLRQLGLSDTGRAEEDKRRNRPLWVLQARAAAPYGVADGLYGLVLPDDALVKLLFKMQKLVLLALHHPCNGYAGPAAYHLGDVVRGHLFAYHGVAVLRRAQLRLYALDVVFELFQLAVTYFSHALIVAFALCTLGFEAQLLHLLLVLLDFVDERLLAFPLCAERLFLVAKLRNVLVELCNLRLVVLPFDSLALYFELLQAAGYFVKFLRHGVTFHAELGRGLVHQVDGLVRQEAV